MKKWLKTIIPVFAFAFILLLSGMQAQAGTITSVKAEAGNHEFTVSGKAEDGVLSVVIFVYDSTGTNLLQMKSVAVDSNHDYTDTFAVTEGTYVVKVADYEGGAFSETSVTVKQTVSVEDPDTTTSEGDGTASSTADETNTSSENPNKSNDSNASNTSSDSNAASQSTDAPETGDASHLLLWIFVMMGSSVILAGSVMTRVKGKIR